MEILDWEFHAKYKATYLKSFYPGLHGHKSSNQLKNLWMLRSPEFEL